MCACFEHKEPLRLSGTSGAARSLGRPDPAFPPGDGADRAQDEALSLVLHISSALPHSSSRGVRGWWCGLWVLIFHGDRAAVFAWGRRRCFRPPPQSCRRCSQELRGACEHNIQGRAIGSTSLFWQARQLQVRPVHLFPLPLHAAGPCVGSRVAAQNPQDTTPAASS